MRPTTFPRNLAQYLLHSKMIRSTCPPRETMKVEDYCLAAVVCRFLGDPHLRAGAEQTPPPLHLPPPRQRPDLFVHHAGVRVRCDHVADLTPIQSRLKVHHF